MTRRDDLVFQFVGSGSEGMIFRTNLCPEGMEEIFPEVSIVKVCSKDIAIGQYTIYQQLMTIDVDERYFLGFLTVGEMPPLPWKQTSRIMDNFKETLYYNMNMIEEQGGLYTLYTDEACTVPLHALWMEDGWVRIGDVPNLTWEDCCHGLLNLVEGLYLLEKRKILHGDVKEPNVLVNMKTKEFRWIDYGIMSNYERAQEEQLFTQRYLYWPPDFAYYLTGKMNMKDERRIERELIQYVFRGYRFQHVIRCNRISNEMVNDDTIDMILHRFDVYGVGLLLLTMLDLYYNRMDVGLFDAYERLVRKCIEMDASKRITLCDFMVIFVDISKVVMLKEDTMEKSWMDIVERIREFCESADNSEEEEDEKIEK